MTDVETAQRARVDALRALEAAEATAWRAHVVAGLLAATTKGGVAYAPGDGDPHGVHLVAADGVLIGETRTTTRGVLGGWHAYPSAGEPSGPYATVRGAAVAVARAALGRQVVAIVRHVPVGAGGEEPTRRAEPQRPGTDQDE